MYAPSVIEAKWPRVERRFATTLQRLPIQTCRSFVNRLDDLWDPDAESLARPLTSEEQAFVINERLVCQIDFRYWAERYCMVNKGGRSLEPLSPFWVSQDLVLRAIATREESQSPDGGLANVLKARQLGVSTLSVALIVHRATLHPNVEALIASDVTTSTVGLFDKADLMHRSLPWWLRPAPTARKRVTSGEHPHLHFDNESKIIGESGKAMRGQKVEESGESKGEIGRSKTFSAFLLSELSTWENPAQIDTALFPAIPWEPYVVGVTESTAKGRHTWHHRHWQKSADGLSRFAPVFIPWGAEPTKYRLPPPAGWVPTSSTLAHAKMCEETWPRWLGRSVTLERAQLYWYERERTAWERDERLAEFLAEYPATPEECFQFSGRSIFTLALRERLREQARKAHSIWLIEPAALAQERAALAKVGEVPSGGF